VSGLEFGAGWGFASMKPDFEFDGRHAAAAFCG